MRRGGGAIWRRLFAALPLLFWLAYILVGEPLGYALFLLATVALHEAGHIFAFLVLREPMPHLRGRGLGLLLMPQSELRSYPRELAVAAAGPLFNLLAAAALLPALRASGATEAHFCFFCFNLMTAALNLLPIRGFDGGRVLFSLLALCTDDALGTKISDTVSLICVLFFYFTGLFLFFFAGASLQILLFSLLLLIGECRRRPWLFEDFGG